MIFASRKLSSLIFIFVEREKEITKNLRISCFLHNQALQTNDFHQLIYCLKYFNLFIDYLNQQYLLTQQLSMLTPRAQGLAMLLTMIALIGCIQKYDYNVVIGIGLIYLGSRHSFLYNLTSFYVLIGLSIGVDIIQMVVLKNQGVFMRYVITAFQIIVKILIIVVMSSKAKKEKAKIYDIKRMQGLQYGEVPRMENF